MQPMPAPPAHIPADVIRLSEFVCITACALHDAHNALKWGMFASFADKELMRDIYIGFESLRRSTDLLSSYIHEWIGASLQSHPDRGTSWVDARLTFWLGFGAGPTLPSCCRACCSPCGMDASFASPANSGKEICAMRSPRRCSRSGDSITSPTRAG